MHCFGLPCGLPTRNLRVMERRYISLSLSVQSKWPAKWYLSFYWVQGKWVCRWYSSKPWITLICITWTALTISIRHVSIITHMPHRHGPPPCHTYIYTHNYTDQCLTLLTTISCHLSAIQWITKMPINVFRQSRCLNTSDSICDLFKGVCDRNDRNDKGNGKSYVRANDRGLQISCHSCHLCYCGMINI
jgi:hypothetical protein